MLREAALLPPSKLLKLEESGVGRRKDKRGGRQKLLLNFETSAVRRTRTRQYCLSKNVLSFKAIKRSRPENDVLKRET